MLKFSVRPLLGIWTPPPPQKIFWISACCKIYYVHCRGNDFGNHFCEWTYDYHVNTFPYFKETPENYPSKEQQVKYMTNVICLCENKGADQLRSNCEADQHICFHCRDSTITLLSKSKISSLQPSSLYSSVCAGPVKKTHCWLSHEAAHSS